MKTRPKYYYINELRLKIYKKPCEYIKSKDLYDALNIRQKSLFSKYFGIQTVFSIKNDIGLFCWDVETVLVKDSLLG